jgi:hypothetical protein
MATFVPNNRLNNEQQSPCSNFGLVGLIAHKIQIGMRKMGFTTVFSTATDVARLLEAVEETCHVGARISTRGLHLAGAGVLATRACSPHA